jgi:hypothetical protein
MTDLIKRLEAAEQGSRELDAEIKNFLNGSQIKPVPKTYGVCHPGTILGAYEYNEEMGGVPVEKAVPPYTTSLDAARSLVPEGYDWIAADVNGHVGGTPYACVGDEEKHFGGTVYLALCIASLRAREAG